MSTYLMVTVSVDRLIRSELPMRSKRICTKKNVIIMTCIYLIIFSLFWSWYLYPNNFQSSIIGSCVFNPSNLLFYFVTNIHFPVRAVLICVIPVIIMLSANIRMLMNIRQSRRRVANGLAVPLAEKNSPLPNAANAQGKKRRRMSALDRMLYYMMIANVSIFIITQIPFHIYSCIRNSLSGFDMFTGALIRAILLIWSSLYFGIAFYFYCLASPLFRQKFIRIIKIIFCCQTMPQLTGNTTMVIG
jgi:hypothetical protein